MMERRVGRKDEAMMMAGVRDASLSPLLVRSQIKLRGSGAIVGM